MLDYKTIIRLKTMGLNNLAIANEAKCKWDSVEPRLFFGVVFHFPAFYEGIVSSLYAAQKPSDIAKTLREKKQALVLHDLPS